MPEVSFAIQAHPLREAHALALADRIGGDVEVVVDEDSTLRSPWRCFRSLLERTPLGATHRFQIQDDAAVCDGLRRAVTRAVEARPDRLLVFFVGGRPDEHARAVRSACARDLPWAELDHSHWCPVVATCWPVPLIYELFEFVDLQRWPEKFVGDDEIVGRFIRAIDHRPLASVPSLVEHHDVIPSLIGRRTAGHMRSTGGHDPGRVAECFIGEGCGACVDEVDWTIGPG